MDDAHKPVGPSRNFIIVLYTTGLKISYSAEIAILQNNSSLVVVF